MDITAEYVTKACDTLIEFLDSLYQFKVVGLVGCWNLLETNENRCSVVLGSPGIDINPDARLMCA